jgi:hypothetical protein
MLLLAGPKAGHVTSTTPETSQARCSLGVMYVMDWHAFK